MKPAQVARIKRLRAQGFAAPAIGARLGIPESTVRNWWNAGECVDCGNPTERSSGVASGRCVPCRKALERAERIWTREAVIAAMQRFAAANGRPPTANEWTTADPVNGYPPKVSVYRTKYHPNAPFASWSEALEAAGFPRPRQGQRQDERWWTRQLVVDELRRGSTDGVALGAHRDGSLTNNAKRFYGTWEAAVHAAGLITRTEVLIRQKAAA